MTTSEIKQKVAKRFFEMPQAISNIPPFLVDTDGCLVGMDHDVYEQDFVTLGEFTAYKEQLADDGIKVDLNRSKYKRINTEDPEQRIEATIVMRLCPLNNITDFKPLFNRIYRDAGF